jgi:glucose-6-phosphate isomerase
MIKLHTENLTKISAEHGLSEDEINSKSNLIQEYIEKIHKRDQGFYKVIDDTELVGKINEFASQIEGKFKDIVVLAIGGSSLGTICLQQSLTHLFQNEKTGQPKLHVIDNIDPILIEELEDVIDIANTLFIVVTKSGSTPETLSEYFYFRERCEKLYKYAPDHFVFVTDPEKGLLRKIAYEENITSFEVPPDVGGRFSVLTAVGLLPAKLIGLDIGNLMKGAQEMRDAFLNEDPEKNLPFKLATIQYLLSQKGKTINVMTPYAQKLIKFADWYRQLLAESTGKKLDNNNKEVNVGITPINALGTTDQHSQSQLYNEGPNDKLHIFMKVNILGHQIPIPNLYPDDESVKYLNNVSFNKLIATEMEGTIQALTQNDRPNITLELEQIDENSLGQLFLFFEGATAFLGEYFNINAFDQPGVELSKQITKKLLSS